ncbi:MAG: 3-deoxy-manno-octulosonate cytidylyltransferase [Fimbriimonadales bacterium]
MEPVTRYYSHMKVIAVIPARMASTRCPGKPLVDLAGKPMIQWVFEAVQRASIPADIVIGTPDQIIVDAAQKFGARGVLTRHDHPTGTDRIAEVAEKMPADGYINVQGDEPFILAESIDACAAPVARGEAEMASVYDWADSGDEANPNVVKVVINLRQEALYFSRSSIPFVRGEMNDRPKKHVGLYCYTRRVLADFAGWAPTPLEKAEVLEQLRFMENGIAIHMSYALGTPLAVDTPEQAAEAGRLLEARARA